MSGCELQALGQRRCASLWRGLDMRNVSDRVLILPYPVSCGDGPPEQGFLSAEGRHKPSIRAPAAAELRGSGMRR